MAEAHSSTLRHEVGLFFDWCAASDSMPDLIVANVKFPEGTVAGLYKSAVATQPNYDILRVDSQRINWTLKELDVSD